MTAQLPPVLSALGVGRVFGEGDLAVRALHATSLQIWPGEVLVIMGPSGSGKTTLLSILGLLLRPSEGQVQLNGEDLDSADEEGLARLRRDNIGFVFQQMNLLSGLTAIENAMLPLLLQGIAANERRVRARRMLDEVGLGDKENAKPRQLSGGQQQRVAIARALITGAAVLLCDEPTASLDAVTGRSVLGLLRRSAVEMGRAVVIVTHDERVLEFGDRTLEVKDGVSGVPRSLNQEGVKCAS